MPVTGIDQHVLTQVCIIVKDIDRSIARYKEILGIEMPEPQETQLYDQTKATYYGQPTNARAKISCLAMGQLLFELIQPIGEPSTWQDFLDQHGEGIHHIAFSVQNTNAIADSFKEYGYNVIQQGVFGGQDGMYTYLDTADLGVVIELLEHFSGQRTFQGPPFPADKGIGTDIICQVGIMVHDIEKTAQRYQEVLGLPAPGMFTTPGYDVVKTTYNGEPSDATARLAFFNLGQLQIELLQPDEKPSVWRDYLEQYGERAHHIAFQIKDTQRVADNLAKYGIPVSQQGLYGDLSGIYTYVASEPELGVALELLESYPR